MVEEIQMEVNIFPAVHVSFEASNSDKVAYDALVLHPKYKSRDRQRGCSLILAS
jgi:hypothetical protein